MQNDQSGRIKLGQQGDQAGNSLGSQDSKTTPVIEQAITGDGNQTIGQVYGGMVVYVSGGQAIIHPPEAATAQASPGIGPNPYKGLQAFQESDRASYFGRSREIATLWERYRVLNEQAKATRLLPIYGPSGSGKSSLARAGLIPELGAQPLPGRSQARVAVLVPGTQPLQALATVLARIAENDPTPVQKTQEFATTLAQSNDAGEHDGLQWIASVLPNIATMPLIVLIDQFEEIYSLCPDEAERDALVANLLYAAQEASAYVSVIVTMRSDFLDETPRHPELNRLFSAQGFLVPTMERLALREAIAEPARQAHHPLDEYTIGQLVEQTEGREGALPMLQFALTRIWEGLLVEQPAAETLAKIGGVGGALAGEAQRVYDSLDNAEQQIARRLFVGLVQLGEENRMTRRRAVLDSLKANSDSLEAFRSVVDRFTAPGVRLITLSSQNQIDRAEITHEALFRHWQLFHQWLEGSRDDLRFQRRVEDAALDWDERGRPQGLLWRSPDLDLLRTFAGKAQREMSQHSVAFFDASDQAEKRAQQLKHRVTLGLVGGLVTTTVLAGFSGYKLIDADHNRMVAYEAATKALAETDPVESMVQGLAAVGLGRSPLLNLFYRQEGEEPGRVATRILDSPNRFLQASYAVSHKGSDDEAISVALSADGTIAVSGSEEGEIRLWNREGKQLGRSKKKGVIQKVVISADGQTIFGLENADHYNYNLWQLDADGNDIGSAIPLYMDLSTLALSADGQTLVVGDREGSIHLLDPQSGTLTSPFASQLSGAAAVQEVAISADGQTIASATEQGFQLWNRQGQQLASVSGLSNLVDIAITADGQTLVSGNSQGLVQLWNHQGKLIKTLKDSQTELTSLAMSADGQTIISGDRNGHVVLWDHGNPTLLIGHSAQSWLEAVAISADGNTIISTGV